MIAEQYRKMLDAKSVIRQLSEKATKRAQIIGAENVFDYSLGNPSVPAPAEFKQALLDLIEKEDPMTLHGYSPTLGIPSVKTAIAESLNCRFDMNYGPEHIFPVSAAAAAIAHALRAVTVPGDEVLTFAPFFPEYHPYVDLTGAVLKVVPADTKSFQINFEAFEEMLGPRVAAVLVNTPNNPSGAVYSAETLTKLAQVLTRKAEQYGHDIFLISDEPYREIVFDGKQQPYVSKFYANTISCYSFSKALSLPGERIGYIAVGPKAADSKALYAAVCGAGRPRVGYDRAELTTCLEDCLGGRPVAAVIVGAGKLGRALLDYAGFSEYGTNILAAFDLNAPAEGDRSELKPVLPMSALADFCAANNVSIGIVTVPKEAAQAVTDVLYRSGVRAFWCFAPCRLQLPPDAVIQYENLALSLAHLKARL